MEEWCHFFNTLSFDNQQTVGIGTKEQDKLSTKLKHVGIHQNWIRQEVEELCL
ncbi:hypothetical protein BU25DRAFT_410630 [Macroventuria anomochaeta]|uniref:Uncharacterized protein n=1 Tax=Macroventuria anomochaeta TaxID=301207 RepID=A0ACB6S3N1_9PLEO|nr:uncharacterized protein BU25DRAFT_410630 [Macroventuria anomochaeta]KAF2628004.1 hypothetical protein BU25DRAFT_410630 [Macroventuria anomochaeta]